MHHLVFPRFVLFFAPAIKHSEQNCIVQVFKITLLIFWNFLEVLLRMKSEKSRRARKSCRLKLT